MSDNEGPTKKGGYRVEYASSARSKCKGPKPCSGTVIVKGELRLGTLVEVRGQTTYAWRHWGCVTPKIITNIMNQLSDIDELDGFDDLKDNDQDRLRRAFKEGKVAEEDIPATARKPADANVKDGDKQKKKSATKKKVQADTEADVKKPREAPVKKSRTKKAAAFSEAEDGAESEGKPQKRAPAKEAPAQKKAPAKKRAPKTKDEFEASDDDDFAEAIAEIENDEGEEVTEQAPKSKRKRTTTAKPASSSKKPRTMSSRQKKPKAVETDDDE